MATLTDLSNAITSLLGAPGIAAILQLNSPTRERAFEAYVFSLVTRAVRDAGGTAEIVGRNTGPNPATVIFRGGPGRLGSTAQDFAYANCQLGQKHFEIHVDVQYEGGSTAVHEVDVSVYDHDAADRLRQSAATAFAKTKKLIGAIECKFYDNDLGTSLGRTFVGLTDDCGSLRLKLFATNGQHQGLTRYLSLDKRPNPFFRLSPLHVAEEQEFINVVKHVLSKWCCV